MVERSHPLEAPTWSATTPKKLRGRNIASGASTELRPQSGLDYAFDSDMAGATDDLWEGHGLERSGRLPGGPNGANYRVRVQFAVTNNTIAFTLDDWHLAVHTNL